MMRRFILPLIVIILSVFGAVALMATAPQLEPSAPDIVATTVRVMEVNPAPVQLQVHSQGSVAPNTESELISEVSGRVVWISPALVNGGYFNANDTLIKIDAADYRSTLSRAQSTLTRAKAEHEHANFEYQRSKNLEARQLTSRADLENNLRALRVAEAVLSDSEIAHQQAQRDLWRTQVKAPFSGLVRNKSVDIGQFVSRGTGIATIYAGDEVEVRLPIADRQLAYLNLPLSQRGELPVNQQPAVTLKAEYAGQKLEWQGSIVRTEAQIDTTSRMVYVVARVDQESQPAPLSVGLYVNAEIQGLLVDNIVSLPRNALYNSDQVLVVDEANKLRFRDVNPMRLYKDEVLINAGLNPGDRVCISVIQTPIDGMQVNPIVESSAATTLETSTPVNDDVTS